MLRNEVRAIPLGTVCAFIIQGESGAILVDSGYPGFEDKILGKMAEAGVKSSDLKLILLTHGHDDHMGSAAALRNKTGAKIAVHKNDVEKLKTGSNGLMIPIRPVASAMLSFLIKNFVKPKVEGFEPDIVIEDEFSLKEYGIAAKVIHTPGHTPGSVSVLFENGDIIVGDLMMAMMSKKNPNKPVWAEDISKVAENIGSILKRNPKNIYISHSYGGPFTANSAKLLLDKFR
jgi:glyoxylase-like metal-dependent hydrolase (beta-lactamase superfamily II)